jgi:hypothetical protein
LYLRPPLTCHHHILIGLAFIALSP